MNREKIILTPVCRLCNSAQLLEKSRSSRPSKDSSRSIVHLPLDQCNRCLQRYRAGKYICNGGEQLDAREGESWHRTGSRGDEVSWSRERPPCYFLWKTSTWRLIYPSIQYQACTHIKACFWYFRRVSVKVSAGSISDIALSWTCALYDKGWIIWDKWCNAITSCILDQCRL